MGTDIYLPSLPAIALALQVSMGDVQLTFSVFLAGFAISQLVYGPLIDRYGRKPFLITGVSLYGLMALAATFAHSIELLLLARTIQGIGAGACSVVPRAIMGDSFAGCELEKVTVYQSLVWSFVPISAPLLGSYIEHYFGWRYNFLFLALISVPALLMSITFKESISKKESRLSLLDTANQYLSIIRDKTFYPSLICCIGVISLLAAFNVSAPVILQKDIGLSTIAYGWWVFMIAISFMIGTVVNRVLLSSGKARRVSMYGFSLLFSAIFLLFILLFFSKLSLYLFVLAIVLLQFGAALIFPGNAAKAIQAFPDKAGKTAAVFGCSIFLGGALTGYIIAVLPENTLLVLVTLYSCLSIIMYLTYRMQASNQLTGEKL
jgi:Bcr/CflA subfamily drug resistance transporter